MGNSQKSQFKIMIKSCCARIEETVLRKRAVNQLCSGGSFWVHYPPWPQLGPKALSVPLESCTALRAYFLWMQSWKHKRCLEWSQASAGQAYGVFGNTIPSETQQASLPHAFYWFHAQVTTAERFGSLDGRPLSSVRPFPQFNNSQLRLPEVVAFGRKVTFLIGYSQLSHHPLSGTELLMALTCVKLQLQSHCL